MSKNINIVFMGTPEFSIPTLEALHKNFNVISVVTQPDRKKGRGKKIRYTPVKNRALELGLNTTSFENINSDEAREYFKNLEIDFIVVVAFGQILKKWLIDMPKYSILNVHASLLPRFRGAAPMQRAIINGDEKTGITIMEIDEGLDTGDILGKVEIPIGSMDFGELHDAMKDLGTELLIDSMNKIINELAIPIRQNPELATYAAMIKKSETEIDWNEKSLNLYNKIRGFSPIPAAYTYYNGKRIKIFKTKIVEDSSRVLNIDMDSTKSGEIVYVDKNSFIVRTSDYFLEIIELQAENGKRMDTSTYLRGNKIINGDFLGS